MPEVVYRPKRGGKYVAPALQPGTALDVSAAEAEHLAGTGALERVTPDPKPEPGPAEDSPPAKDGRKEAKCDPVANDPSASAPRKPSARPSRRRCSSTAPRASPRSAAACASP